MANHKVVQSNGMLDETSKWGPIASSVNKANVNKTQNGNKVRSRSLRPVKSHLGCDVEVRRGGRPPFLVENLEEGVEWQTELEFGMPELQQLSMYILFLAPVKGNQVCISLFLRPQKWHRPFMVRLWMTKCSDLKRCVTWLRSFTKIVPLRPCCGWANAPICHVGACTLCYQ